MAEGALLGEHAGHDAAVHSACFLDGGRRFVSGDDQGELRTWSESTRAVRVLRGHEDWITSLAFTERGLLVTGSHDRTLRAWELPTGRQAELVRAPARVDAIAARSGGGLAFGCWDLDVPPVVVVGDDAATEDWRPLAGGDAPATALAFEPAGPRLVGRTSETTVTSWNADTGESLFAVEADGEVLALDFHPSGSFFATGDETGALRYWNATDGSLLGERQAPLEITAVRFSPDGASVAVGTGRDLQLWSTFGDERRALGSHQNLVVALAFHPDGSRLASGSLDRTVRIWSTERFGPLLSLRGHEEITALAFDASGRVLATASKDGEVRLWWTRPPGG